MPIFPYPTTPILIFDKFRPTNKFLLKSSFDIISSDFENFLIEIKTSIIVNSATENLLGEGVFTNLQHAPYYGNVAKHQYNHYIALIDVASSPAKLVAILDSRGDFLDEEFAEATGQKP